MVWSPDQWREQRVRVETVLQMEAVECGAACLAMILGSYGRYVPLEQLRSDCGVSRDGSKASKILKAARTYGLDAKGYRKETEELHDLPLPMILFWNFSHFVVLEGIKRGKIYINNPASGIQVVTPEEFDRSFTGVALAFKPTETFAPGGEKPSALRSLRRRLGGSALPLTYVLLAGLFLVIPGLVIPAFAKVFVDDVLVRGMDGWLKPLLVAMGVTAGLRAALTWCQQHYLLRLETKTALVSSAEFFRHVLRLPVDFFSQRLAGEISSRVQLNDRVAQLLSGDLATNLLNLVMIAFYALLMFHYDPVLTGVGITIALLNLSVLKVVSSRRRLLNQRAQQEGGKLLGLSMNGLQLIESLKVSGSELDFFSKWSGQHAKVVNAQQQLAVPSQLLSIMPPLLAALNTAVILGLGGLRVMTGEFSMGMLVAFQSLMSSFMQPVGTMVNLGKKLQDAQSDMNRLDDVLRNQEDLPRSAKAGDTDHEKELTEGRKVKLNGRLELEDVSFGYSPLEPPLIEGFSLCLEPGARVALVGSTGSGKSTVAKLVTGLYQPRSGRVLLDGEPRHRLEPRLITSSLAMVDQDVFLFEGNVRENLTMWDPAVPENQITKAARDACIHDDIAARPGGYSSRVEEDGANFSGGQRQRLEIARALVDNPTLLVLDEATSALDTRMEKLVDDNLRRRGCTCLIIAHRLSTIRDCDEIIVLDKGRVVERGTHDELRNLSGLYAELIGGS